MSGERNDFDVGIVGASLAGSTAAILLGKRGKRVILFDDAQFPRRKACGEGLSARGWSELLSLLGNSFALLPHTTLHGYTLYPSFSSLKEPTQLELEEDSTIWGVERSSLDTQLLENARRGVEFLNKKVQRIEQSQQSVCVHTDTQSFRCTHLILASGISRVLSKQCGFDGPVLPQAHRFGASILCKLDTFLERVLVFPYDHGEVFLTPLAQGQCNVSILGPKSFVQDFLEPSFRAKLLAEIARQANLSLAERLSPIVSGPFGRHMERSAKERVFLVGDAAEVLDPIGGMGMTQAILSGKLAATLLSEQTSEEVDTLANEYCRQRESLSLPMRAFGSFIHALLHSSRGRTAQATLNQMPLIRAWLFQQTIDITHGNPNFAKTRLGSRMLGSISSFLSEKTA